MWAQLANEYPNRDGFERPRADSRQDGRIAQKTYLPNSQRAVAGRQNLTANPTCRYRSTATRLRCDCTQPELADLRIGGSANPQEFEDANYQ